MSKTSMLNQVQRTILEQLNSLDPLWRIDYRVETIVVMDENTLRLCCRTKERKVNFDVKYKSVPDIYEVTAYLLWNHGLGVATIVEAKDVMWDYLAELLREAHEPVAICNQCGRSVKPGTGLFVNRVPSFDNAETRFETGYPHPEGDFTCYECMRTATKSEKYKRFCSVCHRTTYEFYCCGQKTRRVNLQRTIGDVVSK